MNVSGVIFSPLEPKKQRSQKKKPDLRLSRTVRVEWGPPYVKF